MNHTMISKALDYSRVVNLKNQDIFENEKRFMRRSK